jgi:hypothetical protein
MRGRLAAGRVAALVLAVLITGVGLANTARAFEWDLPGERKFSIHGFYEARLLFTGDAMPASSNAITFSQFRHVLALEFELSLFPDGFGPFDSMFMFTRVLASYDCIYTRACGLFASADSYGDAARRAVRQPASLKADVQNKSPYFGGLLPMVYIPGTLAPSSEILNPNRRYRECINDPGVFQNPYPLAAFCNLNQRSPLDGPLKPGLSQLIQVRGGDFSRLAREALLNAARPTLGETEFNRLRNLLIGGNTLSITQEAQRRALLADAAEDQAMGNAALAKQEREASAQILGTPATTFDANVPELLGTRPDPNRFAIFANSAAPDLLTAKWGSNKIGKTITPFLATINTPINPKGYFEGIGSLNWFGQYETGLADNMTGIPTGAPTTQDADGNTIISPAGSVPKSIPFFLGPDGIRDTADDLPYVTNNATAQAAGYTLAAPINVPSDPYTAVQGSGATAIPLYSLTAQITVPTASDPNIPKNVELYGVYNPKYLALNGCIRSPVDGLGLGGTFNRTTGVCTDPSGADITTQATQFGCEVVSTRNKTSLINIGRNADGDCISVNTFANNGAGKFVQYEVLSLLSDPRARPAQAFNEPPDATDLRLFGNNDGAQIPARPRTAGSGIVFPSPGAQDFYATHKAVVSHLDLHYTEDELAWNHGASQHEKEFAEGYLEFEMADSQLFARVGKLIVIWGKTELFRNQDRNNPLDIGNGLFGPLDEQRVGQWAADVTVSPEMFMRVGPVEDLRLELLWIFDKFTPTDLGKCGEGGSVDLICLKSFGAMASGLAGIGIVGERRPNKDYNSWATWDYGARIEGRLDRFTFAVSDFWGWDDGFYLDLVQQYERTADLSSGAPLSVGSRTGGTCTIRKNAQGQAVGPNGIPGDGDDTFASAGQCLLWDPPDANGQQHLRAPEAVASLHNVNQTLFHSICAFTFDQDEGYCAFDRLNNPDTFDFISKLLGGLGGLGAIVLDGTETIRTTPNGYETLPFSLSGDFKSFQFQVINPKGGENGIAQDLGVNMQPEQAALLACGPAYANPCSALQASLWNNDPAIHNSLARDPALPLPKVGGIDLMNADASVVTQEFTALKALEPGNLVGTRTLPNGQQVYLPGMNFSRNGTFITVVNPDDGGIGAIEQGAYLNLTPDQVIAMGRVGRAEYQNDPNNPRQADGWIEPMPWKIDPQAKAKFGAIVFENDPNNPFDLNSPLNKWNLIDKNGPIAYSNIDGEYCARWMNNRATDDVNTPFNHGCTVLESASANFERFLIATEIIGFDRVFDPPESLTELVNWGKNNTAIQATGDPIDGPDGIFTRNTRVFNDNEVDFQVFPTRGATASETIVVAPAGKDAARSFLTNYNPTTCPNTECLLDVTAVLTDPTDLKSSFPLTIDLPISTPITIVDEPNDPNGTVTVVGTTKINLAGLELNDLRTLRKVLSGQVVQINGESVQLSKAQLTTLFGQSTAGSFTPARDVNGDSINDLDQDRDGVWDGMDDYTPGPVTDDNILCGTGMKGDPFQEAAQYDPYRLDEAPGSSKFKAKFPNGLPPRSPVFCRTVAGIVGGTTLTLPIRKAGGDGTFGRRDFLWQGGRQVATRYQKKNVFGFGLDFAEDTTKTSWGIEFSWMARKLFANTQTYSGLSQSDELVLSISVDRPTFFNFLNPNRSFFLNFQMFVRYLPNYVGGKRNNDGMYQTAAGPVTTQMVLTFFTGYFQDRLAPRVSMVYWPMESQGAVLTGLSYRWNDAFSTSIGYSNFFGHVYQAQGSYFPIAQYGSVDNYTGAVLGRGAAPVINRDQAELRFRYTW